MVASIPWI